MALTKEEKHADAKTNTHLSCFFQSTQCSIWPRVPFCPISHGVALNAAAITLATRTDLEDSRVASVGTNGADGPFGVTHVDEPISTFLLVQGNVPAEVGVARALNGADTFPVESKGANNG